MNRSLLLIVFALLLSSPAAGGPFGFEAGLARWHTDARGELGFDHSDIRRLGIRDDWQGFYYVNLQHPLYFLPNIKVQRTRLSHDEGGLLEENLSVNRETFFAGDTVALALDLTHTDLTLYYSFLDNWVNVDVGITVRKFRGSADVFGAETEDSRSIDDWIPAIYGHTRFDIPFSGWAIGAEGHVVAYDRSSMLDLRAMVSYVIDPIFGLGFELGYRYLTMDLDESLPYDITYSGPYASVILRF